ncbi:hypothetical protein ABH990_003226 [Bradyrhizobium ottawaense]
MRQPKMERKLGALGQRAEQDQHECRDIERVRTDRVSGSEHLVQVIAAYDVTDQQHAGEEAKSAGRSDHQRHSCAVPCSRIVMPVADQQERKQAGQFPEENQLQQVAGEYDPQHCAHEREQEGKEARNGIAWRHIVAGIQHHQKANSGDQHCEGPCEAIKSQRKRESEFGHPLRSPPDDATIRDIGISRGDEAERGECNSSGEPCLGVARIDLQQGGNEASGERKDENGKEEHLRSLPQTARWREVVRWSSIA